VIRQKSAVLMVSNNSAGLAHTYAGLAHSSAALALALYGIVQFSSVSAPSLVVTTEESNPLLHYLRSSHRNVSERFNAAFRYIPHFCLILLIRLIFTDISFHITWSVRLSYPCQLQFLMPTHKLLIFEGTKFVNSSATIFSTGEKEFPQNFLRVS